MTPSVPIDDELLKRVCGLRAEGRTWKEVWHALAGDPPGHPVPHEKSLQRAIRRRRGAPVRPLGRPSAVAADMLAEVRKLRRAGSSWSRIRSSLFYRWPGRHIPDRRTLARALQLGKDS